MEKKIIKNETTLSQAQIDEWKAAYGHVYRTADGNETIIYRPIRRGEYTKLMMDTELSDEDAKDMTKRFERLDARQTALCKIAVLYPNNIEDVMEARAGLASNLSDVIMLHSGFKDLAASEEL